MVSHVNGQNAAATAAPCLHFSTYRRAILRLIVGSSLFTAEEQLLASHNVHECEDAQRLATWLRNVQREADRREASPEQPVLAVELPTVSELAAPPARATAATALRLLPAHVVAQVKPQPAPAPRPRAGYFGRSSDYVADVHDHHLEQWLIQETGLSFADRLAL